MVQWFENQLAKSTKQQIYLVTISLCECENFSMFWAALINICLKKSLKLQLNKNCEFEVQHLIGERLKSSGEFDLLPFACWKPIIKSQIRHLG